VKASRILVWVAVLGERVRHEQTAAVDAHVRVDDLAVHLPDVDGLAAERLLVESGGLARVADLEVSNDAGDSGDIHGRSPLANVIEVDVDVLLNDERAGRRPTDS